MRHAYHTEAGTLNGPGTSHRPIVLFLPARDEQATVAAVLGRAPAVVGGHPVVTVVVDDGSTDATRQRASAAGARVVDGGGRGLGAAVRAGLAAGVALDGAVIAFCDADGEYDPAELPALAAPILAGHADYVVGSRFAGEIRRMQRRRHLGNRALTAALARIVGLPISDGQSGFRALSGAAAAAAAVAHDYNYAQVLTIDLVAKGFRYAEVPISYGFRVTGSSFVRLGPYLRHVIPAVWRQVRGRGGAPVSRERTHTMLRPVSAGAVTSSSSTRSRR